MPIATRTRDGRTVSLVIDAAQVYWYLGQGYVVADGSIPANPNFVTHDELTAALAALPGGTAGSILLDADGVPYVTGL